MKTIFLENGETKTIDKLSDLPEMTTNLLEVNLKLTPKKNLEGNNFGMPILILFMFFIKFLSEQRLRKKTCSFLWEICEDIKLIEDLHNIESCKGYILLKRQSEINEKLRLINKVNSTLLQISWLDKFFIKIKARAFCKKINLLIYDNDIEGSRSHRFGHAISYLFYLFVEDFQISTKEIIKAII